MCSAASIGQASSVSLLDRTAHDDNKRPVDRVQKKPFPANLDRKVSDAFSRA
jgi:hypothetical protein